jgi:putative two-component system response regulator
MTKEQKKIIVVDDNSANLTACKNVLKPFYEVYPVLSVKKMYDLLEHFIPDLILLDVDMPDVNGYEAAGRLRKDEAFKDIPIIFLSGRVDPKSEMFGLNMGALDYIHKPFVSELLLKRIKTHLSLIDYQKILEERNKSIQEIRAPLNDIIGILNAAMGTDEPGKIKDCLEKADSASKGLLALIEGITSN